MHAYNELRLQHTLQAACLTNSQLACMAWFHPLGWPRMSSPTIREQLLCVAHACMHATPRDAAQVLMRPPCYCHSNRT